MGQKKTDNVERMVKDDDNSSMLRGLIDNIGDMTVASVLPINTKNKTKSTIKYDDLEEKDDRIRQEDPETKLQDQELEDRERYIENLKKKRNQRKKSVSSGVFDSVAKSFGLKSDAEDKADEMAEDLENEKELYKLATARNCNAAFVLNFGSLVDSCSKRHLIESYNKIVLVLKEKRNMYNYETREIINKLIPLVYDEKEELKNENIETVNIKNIQENDDIKELKKKIEQSISKKENE